MSGAAKATASWDAEYAGGRRYRDDPPVPFVDDIVLAAKYAGVSRGLYAGCGNGRNYIPLSEAGLELVGLDISEVAIGQLTERAPGFCDRLVVGDLTALPAEAVYPLVISIQVAQHGTREQVHAHLADTMARVAPGGLLAVRVNSCGTDIECSYDIVEQGADRSVTVRYSEGPKAGLEVHFWAGKELAGLVGGAGFSPLLQLRPDSVWRAGAGASRGQWQQWEGIWRRDT